MNLEAVGQMGNLGQVSNHFDPLWFLAHTRPRLETVALQNLQQQGFAAYLPFYKRLKKTDAGMEVVFEPMFASLHLFQGQAS